MQNSALREHSEVRFNFPVTDIDLSKLQYLAEMLHELRKLSDDLGEDTLSYLLDMSAIEAETSLEKRQRERSVII